MKHRYFCHVCRRNRLFDRYQVGAGLKLNTPTRKMTLQPICEKCEARIVRLIESLARVKE